MSPVKQQQNRKKIFIWIESCFYFLSALLLLGFIVEVLIPGLFKIYFNVSFLALLWIANFFLLVLYDRK